MENVSDARWFQLFAGCYLPALHSLVRELFDLVTIQCRLAEHALDRVRLVLFDLVAEVDFPTLFARTLVLAVLASAVHGRLSQGSSIGGASVAVLHVDRFWKLGLVFGSLSPRFCSLSDGKGRERKIGWQRSHVLLDLWWTSYAFAAIITFITSEDSDEFSCMLQFDTHELRVLHH
jgi:hypothetical protein